LVEALLALPEAGEDSWLLLEAAAQAEPVAPEAAAPARKLLRTPSHHRWEQLGLAVELAMERLDVLHSPDYIPPFMRRCGSVITVHDLAFLRWPELLTRESRAYFNQHIRRAVRSAAQIIAVSQATKADLIELLDVPAEKVHVIYEAPAFDPKQPQPAPLMELPEDYVLFVGTLEPRKNLVRLIEAFADVRMRGYSGWLVLAGAPGWRAEPIVEAIRQHSDYVVHVPIEARDLPALYRRARLLAFPSLYEGFGIPIVEAMSCGTTVLTSNVSSMPEVAGEAALLVDPTNVADIAGGVWRLLTDDGLRADLQAKGLARAAEFGWERAARATLEVYHRAGARLHSAR
jgi:glycosyltransferase involved in cell wall biosynthesis